MSRRRLVLCVATIFGALTLAAPSSLAQPKQTPQSPEQKPRKVKKEPNNVFQEWPKEVEPIITEAELRAYRKLQTDEEREQFIEIFWRNRDSDPDTVENEYKDQYYERIAYANEHFTSGKPGWLTDRGRIYIKFGKPDEVESHPAGGAYERASYEGGGSTTVYPFERWFYRDIPGVRSGVEIEFVDPTGSGEYRMARNPDEKDALLHVPGAGPTLAELVGTESRADRIAGLGGFGRINYQRQQDSPFEVIDLHQKLEAPPVKEDGPGGTKIDRPVVEDNILSVDIKPYYFFQSDGRVITAFTIQADNRELVFRDSGGLQTARLNIFGRITNVAERKVGAFEDSVTTNATPEELAEAKERKSVYGKAVILAPGTYRLDVIVRDIGSGAMGSQHYGFTVPKLDPLKLTTSSIVLAARLESLKDQPGGSPFTIGLTKVVPNISGVYHRGQPVGVYLQVYNAGIDQTTLRPAADVQYVLLKDGKELSQQVEDWRGMSDAGQRLTLARLIDTNGLAPGKYEIQIRIRDHVGGQELSPSSKFTIVQ
jgi:GWxTD domain-containing protein